MDSRGGFAGSRMRALSWTCGLVCGVVALMPAAAMADAPPTLSLSLNKLANNAGYTVTASLGSGDWQSVDCTNGDLTTAQYPTLSWSSSNALGPALGDGFTAPLAAIVNGSEDGDVVGTSCGQPTLTTPTDSPFGIPKADGTSAFAPGTWYFQANIFCDVLTDTDCADPAGHYTQVQSIVVPAVKTTGGGGSGGTGGSGGGTGGTGGKGGTGPGGNGGSGNGGNTGGTGGTGGSSGSGSHGGSRGGSGNGSACSGLKGTANASCRINDNYNRALAACNKKHGTQRASCRKTATVNYHRQLAVLKCQALKGAQKAACIRKADAIKS
jgi:hypothetical protein